MIDPADQLAQVGGIVERLAALGLQPVLIGGMALAALGSRRVTRDFDFVIATPGAHLEPMLDALYARGLELVSRLDADGDVVSTLDNRKVAASRLRIDQPGSASFFNTTTRLRIDLLFDFPIAAAALAERATATKVRSHVFRIASEDDLLRLKKMAQANRQVATDVQDIAFLEARRGRAG